MDVLFSDLKIARAFTEVTPGAKMLPVHDLNNRTAGVERFVPGCAKRLSDLEVRMPLLQHSALKAAGITTFLIREEMSQEPGIVFVVWITARVLRYSLGPVMPRT